MRNKLVAPAVSVIATVFMAVGCANAEDKQEPELTVGPAPEIAAELQDVAAAPVGTGLQRLADMATKDLAANLKIDEADIRLAEAGYVTWRDGSLGCPVVGAQYTQALINGSRIVLKANGKIYHYHSGANLAPTYCAKPAPQKPLPYELGET
jgi:hypothetical protein